MSNTAEYNLSDEALAQLAKTLQVAILTGTDIVDNLRLLRFVVHDGNLVLSPDSTENFENNLNQLLEEIPSNNSPFSS
tara:strand:- start:327 stop:560 length:234 start_codon:yes stop_codon:yes gene_type:complete